MYLLGENTFSNVNFIIDLLVRTLLRYVLREYTPPFSAPSTQAFY